ncbi:MAG: hypothetical protein U0990_07970 [Candidatus Nanopelagicales bacterium]|nr:hypothetical protein [Candidatus Nanopelagicales bacterium]MDZ4250011.1 hypothetical protein [Candidatus Nanopelagicales bacterium]
MERSSRVPITLFTELEAPELVELLARGEVDAALRTGRFGISMAMLDLSAERAQAIRALEARGIEVTAWLLLDPADGYWLNADNAEKALGRFRELDAFAHENDLRLARVGLDIEPPRKDLDELIHDGLPALVRLIRRRRSRATIDAAESAYAQLCEAIRRTGRSVETYCIPLILDEVRAGSTLLRRVLGIVDAPADDRVPMAYSTYLGRALALAFLRGNRAAAIGVTGGGVFADQDGPRVLDWGQVQQQLDWAASFGTERLYVFSLEGCADSGMLPKLADWEPGARPPLGAIALLGGLARFGLRALLRTERALDRYRPVAPTGQAPRIDGRWTARSA